MAFGKKTPKIGKKTPKKFLSKKLSIFEREFSGSKIRKFFYGNKLIQEVSIWLHKKNFF